LGDGLTPSLTIDTPYICNNGTG